MTLSIQPSLLPTSSAAIHLARLCNPTAPALGRVGELVVHEALTAAGYLAWLVSTPGSAPGDVAVIDTDTGVIVHVEVKTARRAIDGKYRCTLRKHDQYGITDHRGADLVALLCVNAGEVTPFVIPTADIQKRVQLCITSDPATYAGRWSAYRVPIDDLAAAIIERS